MSKEPAPPGAFEGPEARNSHTPQSADIDARLAPRPKCSNHRGAHKTSSSAPVRMAESLPARGSPATFVSECHSGRRGWRPMRPFRASGGQGCLCIKRRIGRNRYCLAALCVRGGPACRNAFVFRRGLDYRAVRGRRRRFLAGFFPGGPVSAVPNQRPCTQEMPHARGLRPRQRPLCRASSKRATVAVREKYAPRHRPDRGGAPPPRREGHRSQARWPAALINPRSIACWRGPVAGSNDSRSGHARSTSAQ